MTSPRSTAARNAVSLHAANPDRSRCRLYDGMDTGPEDRRCWLIPGHDGECMTEGEARDEAASCVVYIEESDGHRTRIDGVLTPPVAEWFREQAARMSPMLADARGDDRYLVDAGQTLHILPELEARDWESAGYAIRQLPPKKPGEFAPDHAYNLPKLTSKHVGRTMPADIAPIALTVEQWQALRWFDEPPMALPLPNAEPRQGPPPPREWWATNTCTRPIRSRSAHPLPNVPRPFAQSPKPSTHNQRKAARKRQKAARRGNRSK